MNSWIWALGHTHWVCACTSTAWARWRLGTLAHPCFFVLHAEPLVALDSVLLCNNKLREVPAALLHCWAYVVTLDLRYNQIEELPASLAPLAGVDTLHL